jgi:hypothetical protein
MMTAAAAIEGYVLARQNIKGEGLRAQVFDRFRECRVTICVIQIGVRICVLAVVGKLNRDDHC